MPTSMLLAQLIPFAHGKGVTEKISLALGISILIFVMPLEFRLLKVICVFSSNETIGDIGSDPDSNPINVNKLPYPPNVPLIFLACGPANNSLVTGSIKNS